MVSSWQCCILSQMMFRVCVGFSLPEQVYSVKEKSVARKTMSVNCLLQTEVFLFEHPCKFIISMSRFCYLAALAEISEMVAQLHGNMIKMENFQKLHELKKDLIGIDNLVIPGRVSSSIVTKLWYHFKALGVFWKSDYFFLEHLWNCLSSYEPFFLTKSYQM